MILLDFGMIMVWADIVSGFNRGDIGLIAVPGVVHFGFFDALWDWAFGMDFEILSGNWIFQLDLFLGILGLIGTDSIWFIALL